MRASAGENEETVRVADDHRPIRRLNAADQESLLAVKLGHHAGDFYFFTLVGAKGVRAA
jgi:hypothetical protein